HLQENKDLDKAMKWIDKALEMSEEKPFWMLRQKSLIHAAMGDKKGAVKAAKASLEGAEKAGNTDYVKLNKDSLKEWGAL
ncbi:MAG: dihydrolipoamide dehydrogenase, partial [Sinomicrobium sp.]|nr:dihydrolipoamide dehydrogenase [Sinomicrobium sp.]